MMFRTVARSMIAAAALAAGSSAMASQDADDVSLEAWKPGDQALTCAQLQEEMSALDAELLAMTGQVEKLAKQETTGVLAKQKAGSFAKQALSGLASTLIPGAGGLIGMGIDATLSSAMGGDDRAEAMMKALQPVIERQTFMSQRMQHVGRLYADKCAAEGADGPQSDAQ